MKKFSYRTLIVAVVYRLTSGIRTLYMGVPVHMRPTAHALLKTRWWRYRVYTLIAILWSSVSVNQSRKRTSVGRCSSDGDVSVCVWGISVSAVCPSDANDAKSRSLPVLIHGWKRSDGKRQKIWKWWQRSYKMDGNGLEENRWIYGALGFKMAESNMENECESLGHS